MPRAVVIESTGGPEVLKLVEDQPMPARKPGQVPTAAAAAAVTRHLTCPQLQKQIMSVQQND